MSGKDEESVRAALEVQWARAALEKNWKNERNEMMKKHFGENSWQFRFSNSSAILQNEMADELARKLLDKDKPKGR